MDFLNDLIYCPICKDIIEYPVVLPCGHSICKQHVDKAVEVIDETRKIKCEICDEFHDIPEKGFARNRTIENLLKKEIDSLDLGEEYESVREKCKRFGDLLEDFNKIKNDPEMRIHTVISDLRNNINLRREELKDEIDKEAMEMIKKLDDYEKECKSSIKSDANLNEKLEKWDSDLKQWKQSLNTFKKDKWSEILDISTIQLKELQSEFIEANKNLFLNRLDEFGGTNVFISSNFHKISVEVTELSKYKDYGIKENIRVSKKDFKAVGIDWTLFVDISIDDKGIKYIGVFLNAIPNHPKMRNIKVEFDLMILDQLGMDKNWTKNLIYEFTIDNRDSIYGWGYSYMIRLKELLDNSNLYNAQTDSCNVQAIIKKIEWL